MANADFDIVVAGGGICGLTAGLTAARLGHRSLILTGPMLGGNLLSIDTIEGYPGHPEGIAGYDLIPSVQQQASDAGAEFAMTEATAIRSAESGWIVKTGEDEKTTRALIIATGCEIKALGIRGEERLRGRGVSHCASCDAPLLRDKKIMVVGGGDSALQEALTLVDFALAVEIFSNGPTLTAQQSFQDRVHAHAKIEVRLNAQIEEILGDDGVTAVRVKDCTDNSLNDHAAEAVFIYPGLQPNTGFLNGLLPLDKGGRIPVNNMMRTPLQGLLAAGTVRSDSAGRAVASAGDGSVAALSADRYLRDGDW
jgi:thioredoxin reductase (NADPH)